MACWGVKKLSELKDTIHNEHPQPLPTPCSLASTPSQKQHPRSLPPPFCPSPASAPPQPDELSELKGTAAHDKLSGRVQHPADAPTRVGELFEALVVPWVEGDQKIAKVDG